MHQLVIDAVKNIMVKLGFAVRGVKLRKFIEISPVRSNKARLASVKFILQRYINIRAHLPSLAIPDIDELLPSRQQDHESILDE